MKSPLEHQTTSVEYLIDYEKEWMSPSDNNIEDWLMETDSTTGMGADFSQTMLFEELENVNNFLQISSF